MIINKNKIRLFLNACFILEVKTYILSVELITKWVTRSNLDNTPAHNPEKSIKKREASAIKIYLERFSQKPKQYLLRSFSIIWSEYRPVLTQYPEQDLI